MTLTDVAKELKKSANLIREKKLLTHNDKQRIINYLPTLYFILIENNNLVY